MAVLDQVSDILADQNDLPRERIKPESHILDDLNVDSLDFLDTVYALDKHFGVKIPLESFAEDGHWTVEQLAGEIDQLLAAKSDGEHTNRPAAGA